MRSNGHTIRGHEAIVHPDWETVKEWLKSKLKKEMVADAALCAVTVSVIGVVLFSLQRAIENGAVLGF